MESGFIFQPPPFLGSGFRQNHQIRTLKSNSYPYLTSYRSLQPSSSHASPSLALLTSRGTPNGTAFSRTNLNSHRRKHLRKCFDLVHVCIQRREVALAARFLKVVLAAHEWTSDEGWRLALLNLALSGSNGDGIRGDAEEGRDGGEDVGTSRKIGYLEMLDLSSSAPFKATHITPTLVSEYIAANRLSDAIELLEQRVNVHPYKSQPELHTTLGMLYLFIGIQTLLNSVSSSEEGEGVNLRLLDRTTRNKSRLCFETAIQACETWMQSETQRRQRIYAMHRKDQDEAKKKLNQRSQLWGRDLLEEDPEDAWPMVEHRDIKKIRRRLEGSEVEPEDNVVDGIDMASSASGSVCDMSFSEDDDSEEGSRGRSRTRTQSQRATAERSAPPPDETEPQEERSATRGPHAWAKLWPEVAPVFTPEPPIAFHLAKQFLAFLAPPARQSRWVKGKARGHVFAPEGGEAESEGDDVLEDEGGEEGLGGVQLTRAEAEKRLRRILFEGDTQPENAGMTGDEMMEREVMLKREKGRDGRSAREGRKKRKRDRHAHEHGSSSCKGGKRHRREDRHI